MILGDTLSILNPNTGETYLTTSENGSNTLETWDDILFFAPIGQGDTLAINYTTASKETPMALLKALHNVKLNPKTDPTTPQLGEFWVSSVDNRFKIAVDNGAGGVEVQSYATQAEFAAALTRVQAVETALAAIDTPFDYIGEVNGGADEANAFDLSTVTDTAAGSYYKVATSGYFIQGADPAFYANAGDGLIFNKSGGVDLKDNTNTQLAGTADQIVVVGNPDTGYTLQLAQTLLDRIAALESAPTTGNVVTALNAREFYFESSTAATSHLITHNLNTQKLSVQLWVKHNDGTKDYWLQEDVQYYIDTTTNPDAEITIGDFDAPRDVRVLVTSHEPISV